MTTPSTLERYNELTAAQLKDPEAGKNKTIENHRLEEMDALWETMTEEERTQARKFAVDTLDSLP